MEERRSILISICNGKRKPLLHLSSKVFSSTLKCKQAKHFLQRALSDPTTGKHYLKQTLRAFLRALTHVKTRYARAVFNAGMFAIPLPEELQWDTYPILGS